MGLTQGAFYKKLYPIAHSLFGNDYSSNSNIRTTMPSTSIITNSGAIASQGLCSSIFENSYLEDGVTLRTTPSTLLSSSRVCQRNQTASLTDTIVIDVTSMSTGLYAVGDIIRVSDAFWYYDTSNAKFTYSKNRDYDVAITGPSTDPPQITGFSTSFTI